MHTGDIDSYCHVEQSGAEQCEPALFLALPEVAVEVVMELLVAIYIGKQQGRVEEDTGFDKLSWT